MRGVPLHGTDMSHFFSHEVALLRMRNNLRRWPARLTKRLFDTLAAFMLLILLSPVFLLVAGAIRRDGGPALFAHPRIGKKGRVFNCYKFRTMVVDAEQQLEQLLQRQPELRKQWQQEHKLRSDPRISPLGRWLRHSSLDELPQLLNVIRGEMSLVGPRPVVRSELPRYGDQVGYYLMVRPGMTGLWQVSGRNDVDYDTRVYLDSWYVKNWSLWHDLVILFKTVSVVLSRQGAY
jgi:undecaprenyl-phosphate galactose phosphotransferase